MTAIETATSKKREAVNQQLQALRHSFDEDIRYAPAEGAQQSEDYLLLTLAGETYGFPVPYALEILHVPPIIPVPNVPPAVLGLVNFRGQILSITAIHGLLGLPATPIGPESRIIVTKGVSLATGMLADSVEGIATVDTDAVQSLPVTIPDDKARQLVGQIYVKKRIVFLLNLKQICDAKPLRVGRAVRDPVVE